jgi:hypothetical protein
LTTAELSGWHELMGADFRAAQAAVRASTGRAGLMVRNLAIAGERRYIVARDPNDWLFEVRGDSARGLELDLGEVSSLMPAPDAPRVAVRHDMMERGLRRIRVIDFGGDTPRVLWSRALPPDTNERWSDDGARLLVTADGGYVFDGTTGAALLERQHLGVTAVRRPDTDKPPSVE